MNAIPFSSRRCSGFAPACAIAGGQVGAGIGKPGAPAGVHMGAQP